MEIFQLEFFTTNTTLRITIAQTAYHLIQQTCASKSPYSYSLASHLLKIFLLSFINNSLINFSSEAFALSQPDVGNHNKNSNLKGKQISKKGDSTHITDFIPPPPLINP